MAITTVDGILAGAKPPNFFRKDIITLAAGQTASTFFTAGFPGAALAPTPGLSGAALTTYAGQIPFTNPSAGQKTYLTKFSAFSFGVGSAQYAGILCDRLWHNSGITINSGSVQNINSVVFPARDNNGTTNGDGVLLGLEFSSTGGSNTPTITVSYTNSAGISGRTATSEIATVASAPAGHFYRLKLQNTDIGVRSIQTLQFGGTGWTSGTAHLVAYRILQIQNFLGQAGLFVSNPMTTGLPILHNNTVPFILAKANFSGAMVGMMSVSQG